MDSLKNKKMTLLYICIAVLFMLMISQVTAFFADSNKVINTFIVGDNKSKIVENFEPPETINAGDKVRKEVKVLNQNMPSYIRMYVAVSDSDLSKKFDINFNTTDWSKDSDGYWYYKKVVKKGEETTPLFDTLSFKESLAKGSGLEIICYSESVQAEGFNSAKKAFAAIK